MREVLTRLGKMAARPGWRAAWAGLTLGSGALVLAPLMGQPGYELAEAVSLIHGLLGPLLLIPLGRQERGEAAPSALRAVAAGTLALWTSAAVVFAWACAFSLATAPCNPLALAHFYPVLVLPSGLLAAALGVAIGVASTRTWTAALLWLGAVLASALHTAAPLLLGPQVFAYNHLAGYLPGPLYDEVLHLPTSLLWFRLGTVLLACAVGAAAAHRLGHPRAAQVGLLCTLAFGALERAGPVLGFRQTDASVEAALGGRTETEHAVLVFPASLSAAERERLEDDVEFRLTQVAAFFGGAPDGKVRVWWYPDAAAKQRLVGAGHTQFSKPWRREVHVNAAPGPHPVLKHELVHALAAPWGSGPFGVAARWGGLMPHAGVIEGLAVAADDPADELTLHQWAAAMQQQGLLPDVRTLLAPQGFYAAPPSRAYATAGSFLKWLGDAKGRQRLRLLYRAGDFPSSFGAPLEDLATEWEHFLAQVPLDPQAVNLAFARFRGGSLFERPCAREVALELEAAAVAEAPRSAGTGPLGPPPRQTPPGAGPRVFTALAHYTRCRALQPEEPAHVLAQARLRGAIEPDDADRELATLEQAHQEHPTTWAEVKLARATLASARGRTEEARQHLLAVQPRGVAPAFDRTAAVRLWGLARGGAVAAGVEAVFAPGSEALRLERLAQARTVAPLDPVLAYLLGRRLSAAGRFGEAKAALEAAQGVVAEGWPAALGREAARLYLEAAALAGDCALATQVAGTLAPSSPEATRAADLVARCDFVARRHALR